MSSYVIVTQYLIPFWGACYKRNVSSIFFYKTTGPTVLKFHMEHDLTPGCQTCKFGSDQISKMATVTENSKNNKINFFSRTTGYFLAEFWHGISVKHRYSDYKNETNLQYSFVTVTYFPFTSVNLLQFVCLKITYFNNFKHLLL